MEMGWCVGYTLPPITDTAEARGVGMRKHACALSSTPCCHHRTFQGTTTHLSLSLYPPLPPLSINPGEQQRASIVIVPVILSPLLVSPPCLCAHYSSVTSCGCWQGSVDGDVAALVRQWRREWHGGILTEMWQSRWVVVFNMMWQLTWAWLVNVRWCWHGS
jgi:hypothetical protein